MKLRALDKYTPTQIPDTLKNSLSLSFALLDKYVNTYAHMHISYIHSLNVAH